MTDCACACGGECATGLAYADTYDAHDKKLVERLIAQELALCPPPAAQEQQAEETHERASWIEGTAFGHTLAQLEQQQQQEHVEHEPLVVGKGLDDEQREAVMLEYELVRAENLLLLRTYGADAWARFAEGAAATQSDVEAAVAETKQAVEALNKHRAAEQHKARAQLDELHALYVAEVRKNAAIRQHLRSHGLTP